MNASEMGKEYARGAPELAALVERYRAKWNRVKLDIGCGTQPRGEDFIGVDKYAGEALKFGEGEVPIVAAVKAPMWDLPFDDGGADEIWCSHALEHVPSARVVDSLKEFHRVLRVGGRAIITVPDMDYVAKYWLLGENRVWAEQMLFGHQAGEGELHRCGFNAELLQGDVKAAGFEQKVLKIVWTHNQQCLQVIVVKPPMKKEDTQ